MWEQGCAVWGKSDCLSNEAEVHCVMPGWPGPCWCYYHGTGMSQEWQTMVRKLGASGTGGIHNALIHIFM